MILQWRGFMWWGRVREFGDGSPPRHPAGSRSKPRYGAWGTKNPEAEAKCEISVQCLTFFSVENLGFNESKKL